MKSPTHQSQMTEPFIEKLYFFCLSFLLIIVFAQGIGHSLIFDSVAIVGGDTRIQEINQRNLITIWTENYWWPSMTSDLYRPLFTSSLLVNYAFLGSGVDAAGYQIVNILLHITSAIVAHKLLLRLGAGMGISVFSVLLFSVHPATVEIVPNIVGRSDILATLASLLGMHIYLAWWEGKRRTSTSIIYLSTTGILGILCKESGVVLSGLILWHLIVFGPGKKFSAHFPTNVSQERKWENPGTIAIIAAAISMVILAWVPKLIFQEINDGSLDIALDNPLLLGTFLESRLTALAVLGRMICAIFLPLDLSPDYSFNQIPLLKYPWNTAYAWESLLYATGVIVLAIVAIWARKRRALLLAFSIGAGLIALLPTANLIVLIGTIRADRFMYLPTLWFALGLASLMGIIINRVPLYFGNFLRMILYWTAIVLISLQIALTFYRCRDWQNSEQFWMSSFQSAPNSFKGQIGYAAQLLATKDLEKTQEALWLLDKAESCISQLEQVTAPRILTMIGAHRLEAARIMGSLNKKDIAIENQERAKILLTKALVEIQQRNKFLDELEKSRGKIDYRASTIDVVITLAELLMDQQQFHEASELLIEHYKDGNINNNYIYTLIKAKAHLGQWPEAKNLALRILLIGGADLDALDAFNHISKKKLPLAWKFHYINKQDQYEIPRDLKPADIHDPVTRKLIIDAANELAITFLEKDMKREAQRLGRKMRQKIGIIDYAIPNYASPVADQTVLALDKR